LLSGKGLRRKSAVQDVSMDTAEHWA